MVAYQHSMSDFFVVQLYAQNSSSFLASSTTFVITSTLMLVLLQLQ